ncbi:P-loop containing nucleoside triphosphate hydrolase protein [Aspergillus cavernicola]|uniref:P-loop containing nucleoside triphosphate hydrolase protein n=1 Tax=Aspergillus cavernicola TaxID=176166 RepID=A0ABR4HFB0_9EURO
MPQTTVGDGNHCDMQDMQDGSVPKAKGQKRDVNRMLGPTERQLERVLDRVMCLIGQEPIKEDILAVKARVEHGKARREDMKAMRFDLAIMGNPGTGKNTAAHLYAELLACLSIVPQKAYSHYMGFEISECDLVKWGRAIESSSGVFFIRRAHRLTDWPSQLDKFLTITERHIGRIVVIMIDPTNGFRDTGKARWRFRRKMVLADYQDAELHRLLAHMLKQRRLHVEGGFNGRHLLVLHLGNIWAVRSELEQALQRQARRLRQIQLMDKRTQRPCSQYLLTRADLVGPPPTAIRQNSLAWKQLQAMVGLHCVKASIEELVRLSGSNGDRERQGKPLITTNLNRVIVGPPGTGKTTIAKLYGQIIGELGLLSNGEVVIKTPADFIRRHIGRSEANTRDILSATEGKVLIIDDAHMLYESHNGDFRQAIADTLVSSIHNRPSDNRCIILSIQLVNILELILARDHFTITEEAKQVACETLTRASHRPNFGNGGEVENLLSRAKMAFNARVQGNRGNMCLEPQDFDPDYNRLSQGRECDLFSDMVGMEEIATLFRNYQKTAEGMHLHGIDPREYLPFSFVFKGPPGTGKTTTARIMGKIFYNLGFLSTTEVIECSVIDIIGKYVGHTGPKVISLLERALGKVLFVDEAYRFAEGASNSDSSCSNFRREAVGELVDCMTKPRYKGKIVIILTGYTLEMNRLMQVNPGLRSRFPKDIEFPNMAPEHCLNYLEQQITKLGVCMPVAESDQGPWRPRVLQLFSQLGRMRSWANARDVEELAHMVIGKLFQKLITPGELPSLSLDSTPSGKGQPGKHRCYNIQNVI